MSRGAALAGRLARFELYQGRRRAQRGGARESWQEPDVLAALRLAGLQGDSWELERCAWEWRRWLRGPPLPLP